MKFVATGEKPTLTDVIAFAVIENVPTLLISCDGATDHIDASVPHGTEGKSRATVKVVDVCPAAILIGPA